MLEGGVAGAGGAKSTGGMIPLAGALVGRPKYRRSICGEILGSAPKEVASDGAGLFVAASVTEPEAVLLAGEAGLFSVSAPPDGVGGVDRVGDGASGGGSAICIKFVAAGAARRKRKAGGPTAGK